MYIFILLSSINRQLRCDAYTLQLFISIVKISPKKPYQAIVFRNFFLSDRQCKSMVIFLKLITQFGYPGKSPYTKNAYHTIS